MSVAQKERQMFSSNLRPLVAASSAIDCGLAEQAGRECICRSARRFAVRLFVLSRQTFCIHTVKRATNGDDDGASSRLFH